MDDVLELAERTLTAVRTDGRRVAAVHIGARLDGAR
jgi:hypothetical protein